MYLGHPQLEGNITVLFILMLIQKQYTEECRVQPRIAMPAYLHADDAWVVQLLGLAQIFKVCHVLSAHVLQGLHVHPARHLKAHQGSFEIRWGVGCMCFTYAPMMDLMYGTLTA